MDSKEEMGKKCKTKILIESKKFAVLFFCSLSPYTLLPRGRGRGSLAVPAAPAAGRGRFHSSGPGGGHTAHRGGHSRAPGGGPGGAAGVTVWVHLSIKGFLFLDNILTDSDKLTPPPSPNFFCERNTKSIN
jgi:hypothetical protein